MRERALAALLVLALLFCHGALGPVHQLSGPAEHPAGHQVSVAATGAQDAHSPSREGLHLDGAEYAAALFVALLGVILGALLKGARLWRRAAGVRLRQVALPPPVLCLPRKPSLPVLQVFRI